MNKPLLQIPSPDVRAEKHEQAKKWALYEYRSIILTLNKALTGWGKFFFDDNAADRIIRRTLIFMLGGESYRLKPKLNNSYQPGKVAQFYWPLSLQPYGQEGIAAAFPLAVSKNKVVYTYFHIP